MTTRRSSNRNALHWMRGLWLLLLAAPALAAAFGFDDVAAQAAALARQPYQAPPPAAAGLATLSYDDYRDIRFRPERSRWRDGGSLFQLQFFPLGRSHTRPLRLYELQGGQAAGAGRAGRRLPGRPCRQRRAAACRRCRLASELPAEPRRPARRADRLSRRQLLPRHRRAAGLRPVGARRGGGHCRRQRRGVPGLHRLLVRAPGPGSARDALLCPARRPARERRLWLRGATRHRYGARRAGPAVPARAGGHARHRAADEHVPGRREPAGGPRLPARGARLRRPAGGRGRRRDDLAPADQPGAALRQLLRAGRTARLRPDAARPRLQQLRGPGGALPAPAQRLGRAARRLGAGPGRAAAVRHARRNPRQHRRLLGAATAAAAGRSRSTWPGACTGRATTCRPRRWRACSRRGAATATVDAPLPPGHQQLHVDFAGPSLQALPEGAAVEAVASANANVRALRANAYPPHRTRWLARQPRFRAHRRAPAGRTAAAAAAWQATLLTETWAYALAPE